MMGWCPHDSKECHFDGYCGDCPIERRANKKRGQNSKTIKLENCPFCGGEATLVEDKQYKIFCTKCDCQYGWCEDRDDVIRGWNRREGGQDG